MPSDDDAQKMEREQVLQRPSPLLPRGHRAVAAAGQAGVTATHDPPHLHHGSLSYFPGYAHLALGPRQPFTVTQHASTHYSSEHNHQISIKAPTVPGATLLCCNQLFLA